MSQSENDQALVADPVADAGDALAAFYPDETAEPETDADDTQVSKANEPDAPTEDDAADGEADDADAVAEPVVPPPASWTAENRELFAQMPPELQRQVAERETQRERAVNASQHEVQTVKRQVDQTVAQRVADETRSYADQLQQFAALFEVAPPDPSLLNGGEEHRAIYFQQEAAYLQFRAQREQAQLAAQAAQQEAETREARIAEQFAAEQNAILAENIPEWADETSRTGLLRDLTAIAKDVGYPPELIAEANATDILALRRAHEWKTKADKWDAAQKAKMVPVRAAKQAPRQIAPGTRPSQPAQFDPLANLYPNDVRKP